jgi:FKBP-type peptidyl-prolyl cis-trans isomerase (trigger factor)
MDTKFKIIKKNQLPDSEIEIEGEISAEAIEENRKAALEKLNARLDLPGFRKGHIPEKVITDRVGELGVLEEAASLALENLYLEIMRAADVNSVGRPAVSITKLAVGNPLGFKIKIAVVPEIKLPNYKKLAKEVMSKEEKAEVTPQEFEDVSKKVKKPEEMSEEEFKNKLQESLKAEKELRLREKRRLGAMDKIIAEIKINLPKILIDGEEEKMLAQFKSNLNSMGIKPEDYYRQINKTEDQLKTEWRPEAEKRAKMELILQKIALEEKIEPDKEQIEHETKHLLSHYPDADPLRAKIYIEQILTNEKVWQFLESQK